MADFANIRQVAEKIVYSTTLHPDVVREMKVSASNDLTVGGPTLAAQALHDGLVDECQLFIYPVLVGNGKPAFFSDARVQLDLLEEHRFDNGVVNLRYRIQS
jgi:dihydrofolate reductase